MTPEGWDRVAAIVIRICGTIEVIVIASIAGYVIKSLVRQLKAQDDAKSFRRRCMDKSKQVETKENNLIGLPEIYERLWECRDFELSTLWQRSVFLGAFMLAAYAGYGVLILNAIGTAKGVKWTLLNLMAMGVCWLGVVLAALWIMMLKGSKTWYEIYETAIDDFGKKYPMAFQKIPHDTECTIDCAALSGFGFVWSCKRHRGVAWSDNLFTCEGG